jgi:hypothetical protein
MSLNTSVVKEISGQLGGPLSKEQIQFLRDVQGFIEYAIRNGLSYNSIYLLLRHDLDAVHDSPNVLHGDPMGVLPRLKGMAKELQQLADDPAAMKAIREAEAEFNG